MSTILLGNDFNQLEFIIEFKDGKSFNNTEIKKLSLTVSGGNLQKQYPLLPKRSFPIFGKKKYLFKNKDLKNIHAEVNESENLFFTFSYIDKDFTYEDIVVKFETGWLQDGNLYERKNKNNWGRINNLKHCELVKEQNGRSKIKIIFNKKNTHIEFKVVDIKNRVLENAHVEFVKPFNMKKYLGGRDKFITSLYGKVDFNGTNKKIDIEKKEIDAQVLITKEGFLPKWLNINVKLGINNEKTHIVRLLKRNKAKLDDDYCSSLGMILKNDCNECECEDEDKVYYSELKICDKKCMENEFSEMITNEYGDDSVKCIELPPDVIEEIDVIPIDEKRMSIEIEFGNHKHEKMDLYILEEIYDNNKFLEELGSFEVNKIGEIELIKKNKNSKNKIGILNVIEDYRFEDEVCEGMSSDPSDLNFIKYNSNKSPYYDISKRGRGYECEYFYNFDASIFNNYLITFYFSTDNEELYKYTLHPADELHEFRDVNDLNLVFIINNKNQIELKNKDDFQVQKTTSVQQSNNPYKYKAKECDDNCCELINTLNLNLEECEWEASYVLSEALFFDCIDEIEFEISSLKLIIKSLYKYLTNKNDNELISEMMGINDRGHTSSSVADPFFFIEPQAVSLLMMYFKHSLHIMKERNENFGLCDKAEIYFLKAEFYYLIAQLLLVKEKALSDWDFKIEQIDFTKNKRIDEKITIHSIIPDYTIPIKNIYFYIGDNEHVYEIVVHEKNNKFDNKKNIQSITLPRFTKEVKAIGKKLNSRSAAKIAKDTYIQYKILSGNAMTIEGCIQESTYAQIDELKIMLHK